ncbi:hypothetical protein KFK09_024934 [Dendrobium nobile]|uniref:Retrovirus-related Pol polyprotein from transposon TNT 1-94 n=1 Tax=Dendrobium nobile TaxID=94219 RepID=A0A8T3AFF3_DENNO|nr:hypothetical protein KFK09_024934 [Dendrobium nobile]
MFNKTPNYSGLKVFGCECYPLLPPHTVNKLQPKSQKCIFLGYSDQYKGYRCLNPVTNKIMVSRHVHFIENSFPFSEKVLCPQHNVPNICPLLLTPASISTRSNSANNMPENQLQTHTVSQQPVTASDTTQPPPQFGLLEAAATANNQNRSHPMTTRSKTGSLKPRSRLNLLHSHNVIDVHTDPTTFTEASKSLHWRQAMVVEVLALQKQGTWSLVEPPANATILGSKWTFRTKYLTDGSIGKYKARLVAQGNNQEYGLDYTETFSHEVKLPTIRIMLTLALYNNWTVQQLDVANAFLHGKLTETIYIRQPKGFEDSSKPEHVCRLNKAIYGLKQAPRQWYNTFTSFLLTLGFNHSQADPSLLIYAKNQVKIFLLIYVDDILITGNSSAMISSVLTTLDSEFAMKHLGEVHDFLGIKITKTDSSYFLSQAKYAYKILQ